MASTHGDHAVKGKLAVSGNAKFEHGSEGPYLEVVDTKEHGTLSGSFNGVTATDFNWQTRDLTHVEFNDLAISVVSGSENLLGLDPDPTPGDGGKIVLESGVYYCEISAPAFSVNEHIARLADVTDNPGSQATTVVLGTTEFAADAALWEYDGNTGDYAASSMASTSRSEIKGRFRITGQRTLEIQHLCRDSKAADGFGSDGNFYELNNVYTTVKMWLLRDDT